MFKLPYIPTSQDLLDKAFRAGRKAAGEQRGKRGRKDVKLRWGEEKRITTAGKIIEGDLKAVIKYFPSFEQLPLFYQRLIEIKVGKDDYKKSLGAVQWALNNLQSLRKGAIGKIQREKDTSLASQYLGRTSSIIKQISKDLDRLVEIKQALRQFPDLKDAPTIVISGYPNAGKSTFLKNLTAASPQVAGYPFTTKDLNLGYVKVRHQSYQLIDSPGLLDRPSNQRNKVEQQAVLAVEELADALIFILDPVQDLGPQLGLLAELEKTKKPLFLLVNKIDLIDEGRRIEVEGKLSTYTLTFICANNPDDCKKVFNQVLSSIH